MGKESNRPLQEWENKNSASLGTKRIGTIEDILGKMQRHIGLLTDLFLLQSEVGKEEKKIWSSIIVPEGQV